MTLNPNDLVDQMHWRYATKRFDPSRKIEPSIWKALEEALVLTPSSYGLQPYQFIVVQDPALRARLRPESWGQSQIEEASHLVVFAIKKDMGADHIDHYLDRIAEVRGVPRESLGGFRAMMLKNLVESPAAAQIDQWAARQAYIALGNFMTAAAMLGVDTCAIEGLDPAAYDRILGLEGFATVCVCAAGYRSEGDKYAELPKVRFPETELIQVR